MYTHIFEGTSCDTVMIFFKAHHYQPENLQLPQWLPTKPFSGHLQLLALCQLSVKGVILLCMLMFCFLSLSESYSRVELSNTNPYEVSVYCNSSIDNSGCRGIDLSQWQELLKEKGEVANLEKFVQYVHGNGFIPNTVLVDCTADSVVASHYYNWLRRGIHVITPNKKANSGPLDQVISLPAS